MKISFIVPSLSPKGPTYQLFNLIENLQCYYDISLYVLSNPHKETVLMYENLKIDISYIPVNGALSFYRARKIIKERQSDILHSHGIKADLMNVFINQANSASIATIRNIPWNDYPSRWRFFGWIVCIVHCIILMRLTTVACSTWMVKPLGWINCKLAVNNATNDSFYIGSEKTNFKGEFFYVGSLSRRKNVQRCIEFLESVNAVCSIDIYGAGEMDLKSDNITVRLHGSCAKSSIDASNKIFISMSESEGLPNSVLEALNTGCYCLLSDIPAHRVIKKLFPSSVCIHENHEKSFAWLKSLSNDLTTKKQKERSQFNTKINSTKHMAEHYVTIYEKYKISRTAGA